jgi:hypothetical protein
MRPEVRFVKTLGKLAGTEFYYEPPVIKQEKADGSY